MNKNFKVKGYATQEKWKFDEPASVSKTEESEWLVSMYFVLF